MQHWASPTLLKAGVPVGLLWCSSQLYLEVPGLFGSSLGHCLKQMVSGCEYLSIRFKHFWLIDKIHLLHNLVHVVIKVSLCSSHLFHYVSMKLFPSSYHHETCRLGGLVRLEQKLMGAIKSGRNWLNSKMCNFRVANCQNKNNSEKNWPILLLGYNCNWKNIYIYI